MLATVAWSAAANTPSGLRTRPRGRTCAYSGYGSAFVAGSISRATGSPRHCNSRSRERRLQELADADSTDSDDLAAGVTPVQAWAIGQALLVGLQIYKRLAPGLVTPEVCERAFGLLADLYQEQ